MKQHIEGVKKFYNALYSKDGFDGQWRYPNEALCRFMGRNFFEIPFEERKDIKILETGCGSGANLWMMAKEGFDAYGIDLSEDSLALCEKMLAKYDTKATLSVQDMAQTNFEYYTFDAVVDVFSSYCLDKKSGEHYLNHVYDILKLGGIFFSYFPSKRSDAYQNHEPSELLDSDTLSSIARMDSPYYGQWYPFRFMHPEVYANRLERKGFKIQYLETVTRTYRSMRENFEFIVVEARKE